MSLEQFGLKADCSHSGTHALKLVQKRYDQNKSTYKLIFLLLEFPGSNAIETAGMIRRYLSENAPLLPQPYIACLASEN